MEHSREFYLWAQGCFAIFTIVVGNLAVWRRRNRKEGIGFYDFLWQQGWFAMKNPAQVLIGVWGILIFAPLTPIALVLAFVSDVFDLRTWYKDAEDIRRCKEFKERYNMEYRFIAEHDTLEHMCWEREIVLAEIRKVEVIQVFTHLVARLSAKVTAGTVFLFNLLVVPLTPKVCRAEGQEKSQADMAPVSYDSGQMHLDPPKLAGVLGGKAVWVKGEGTTLGLFRADLKVSGELDDQFGYFTKVAFGKFANGRTDPVDLAYVEWHPAEGFALQAGRVFNFVGQYNDLPPEANPPITYPDVALSTELLEHGVLAAWVPNEWLALDAGFVAGNGLTVAKVTNPDVLAKVRIVPVPELMFGASTAFGPQDDGWAETFTGFLELKLDPVLVQSEGVVNLVDAGWQSAGAHLTLVWRPAEWLESYARWVITEKDRSDDEKAINFVLLGVNFRPIPQVALRTGVEFPLGSGPPISVHTVVQAVF